MREREKRKLRAGFLFPFLPLSHQVIEGRVFESLPEDSNVETVEVIDLKNESSRNTIVRYRETSQHPELFEKATMESPVVGPLA